MVFTAASLEGSLYDTAITQTDVSILELVSLQTFVFRNLSRELDRFDSLFAT